MLRNLRESKGLSQVDLAKAIGVPQTSIAAWENGKNEPRLSAALALAAYFGVAVESFASPPAKRQPKPQKPTGDK